MNRTRKLVALLVILAAIAVLVNYKSLHQYWRLRGRQHPGGQAMMMGGPEMTPMGNPEAKVRVRVLISPDIHCQWQTFYTVRKIAEKYADRVYVEFPMQNPDEKVRQEAMSAGAGCMAALTINGKSYFTVKSEGKSYKVMLTGQMATLDEILPARAEGKLKMMATHGYTQYEFELALRQMLAKEYKIDVDQVYGELKPAEKAADTEAEGADNSKAAP